MKRFHFSCLFCRWRRAYYGWAKPPYWINYTMVWNYNPDWIYYQEERLASAYPWRVKIDPRGHFTRLRCAAIMVLDRVLKRIPRFERPLVELCSFLACHPTW